jgi:hypothetical protein
MKRPGISPRISRPLIPGKFPRRSAWIQKKKEMDFHVEKL